jgi:phage tail-like protein
VPITQGETAFGLQHRFRVTLTGFPGGNIDLGSWQSCEGLSVEFNPVPREEGGNNDYVYWLPGQVKYTDVTLKRAMVKSDFSAVQGWLKAMVGKDDGGTMRIELLDASHTLVGAWSLRSVFPKKWSGPSLAAGTSAIAIETLVLVHEGFL